jgi:hypothetical protein
MQMLKRYIYAVMLIGSLLTTSNVFSMNDTLRANSLLYNGVEYTSGLVFFNEAPFFLGSDFYKGDINYNGNWYKNIFMQYDCKNDVLVVLDAGEESKIQLIHEKLDEFIIADHHFVKLNIQKPSGAFYEEVHQGKRTMFVQWQKKVVRNQSEEPRYVLFKNIFIMHQGNTIRISKISDLFNLFGQNEKKAERFYKDKHLKFRKDAVLSVQTIIQKAESEGW